MGYSLLVFYAAAIAAANIDKMAINPAVQQVQLR
jgi:hypothetical protein